MLFAFFILANVSNWHVMLVWEIQIHDLLITPIHNSICPSPSPNHQTTYTPTVLCILIPILLIVSFNKLSASFTCHSQSYIFDLLKIQILVLRVTALSHECCAMSFSSYEDQKNMVSWLPCLLCIGFNFWQHW